MNDSQNADIFSTGLSSAACVAILVNCIKNVEKQIVKIFSKREETKNSQIVKGEQHLLELNEAVTLISEKFDKYEREKVEREKIMKKCTKKIKDMPATIQSFKVSLDRLEQYSGKNCLLIHGLPENRNENTNQIIIVTLKEKTGEEISEVDLDCNHRLGAPKDDKARPIIV